MAQERFDEALGAALGNRRRALAISQEFLAEILRRDQTFVSKVETGKRALTLFEFIRWSRALNLKPEEIMEMIANLGDHVE